MGAYLTCDPEYHAANKQRVYDARGIYLANVCPQCRAEKLSKFRPDVLDDPNYWHDEPIDGEPDFGSHLDIYAEVEGGEP